MSFEVIGEDGMVYEIEGDVMGDVMGESEVEEVVGHDEYGQPIVVGARRRGLRRPARGGLIRAKKPKWRQSQMAPGVIAPDQGLLPLPMNGLAGNTFSLATQAITFQGQLQKPFRGERLLVSTVRTGASATGRLVAQLFVGTDLQQGDIAGFDAEQVGDPGAFGVRLTMSPAQPGVFIRLVCTLNVPLVAADTIIATVTLLGRIVH